MSKSIATASRCDYISGQIAIDDDASLSGEKTEGRGNEAWHVIRSPPSWASLVRLEI